MGPRSEERGRRIGIGGVIGSEHASMGPRSEERGRRAMYAYLETNYRLQWGRARRSAEGDWGAVGAPWLICFNGAALGGARKGSGQTVNP